MTYDSNRPKQDSKLSRRHFLGVAGAGAVAGTVGSFSNAHAESISPGGRFRQARTDVIVAGAGMGGLTAALAAQHAGASVILLEKHNETGGTMRESAGTIHGGAADYEGMRKASPLGDAALQRAYADALPLSYAFYESIDAPISPPLGGNALMRDIGRPPVAFADFLTAYFQAQGGTLMLETPLLRLLTNRMNEVIGVLADGPDGPIEILAKAVIVSTGGWSGNAAMVHQFLSRDFNDIHQRNMGFGGHQPALTGDGFWAASQVGAAPSDGGFDSYYGHALPAAPANFNHPLIDYSIYHGASTLVVNLHGRRFTDESKGKLIGKDAPPNDPGLNVEIGRQPSATAAFIWDHETNQNEAVVGTQVLGAIDKVEAFKRAGAPVAVADTIEELANQMERWGRQMPAEVIRRELTEYNEAARNGKAWMLPVPKQNPEYAKPLGAPPYYAVLAQTGLTGSFGALKTNPQGQVMSRTGRPVPGLYAAGIDIGNLANYVYLGFLGYGAAFGYISGNNAARYSGPRGGWDVG